MSNVNAKASDRAKLLAVVNPQSANSAQSSGYVDMSKVQAVIATVIVGAIGASGTVDAKLQQAKDGSGTSVKDITGKAITQLTKANSDDNKQALIVVRPDELDVANGFTHVKLVITPATAASLIAGTVVGLDARYQPQTATTTLAEVVGG